MMVRMILIVSGMFKFLVKMSMFVRDVIVICEVLIVFI